MLSRTRLPESLQPLTSAPEALIPAASSSAEDTPLSVPSSGASLLLLCRNLLVVGRIVCRQTWPWDYFWIAG